MDIFRYLNPTSSTKMEQGEIINGLTSKMWIERYRESGEFTLKARIDSGVRNKLPIGSFISHVDTKEIMIVENHEISEGNHENSDITITGRGLETFFENRVVGSNISPTQLLFENSKDYILAADYTWAQCLFVFNDHTSPAAVYDDDDGFPYLEILSEVSYGRVAQRKVPKGPLYNAMLSLLEIENLGLKVVRPGIWFTPPLALADVALVVHNGVDRRDTVVFSYLSGEIQSADYFWTNRMHKTAAFVMGTWLQTRVVNPGTFYDRRMILVDGTDIDQQYTTLPVGATRTAVLAGLTDRGQDVIDAMKNIALTKVDTERVSTQHVFRRDYEVGDLVTVNGNYNESTVMRVTEFVEIEDENGQQGYPTLTVEE